MRSHVNRGSRQTIDKCLRFGGSVASTGNDHAVDAAIFDGALDPIERWAAEGAGNGDG